MKLIGPDNLQEVMIGNGFFEVKEKLIFSEHSNPKQYNIEKKENLTKLGVLFSEFGFKSQFYLNNPIDKE